MDIDRSPSDEQAALWNGVAGHAWVAAQDVVEQAFKPLENLLVEVVSAASARCVLDIGCGTGSTTLAIARSLGPTSCCVGLDISGPMIDAARARAGQQCSSATFTQDDAQSRCFEPECFDMIVSRFGVMFFGDTVRAFRNLRYAARTGGHLRMIVWRSADENPFMTTAERAAAPLLPNIPPRLPDAPGQFAFADRSRVYRILEESAWAGIEIRPIDIVCTFPEKELVRYFTRLGPLGRILDQAEEKLRKQVIDTVRAAFEPYLHGAEVRFTAACWDISAYARVTPMAEREESNVDAE